ncbi:MAG TPA: GAF domain-containing sensor histidine kinase [Candidatus Eremiobacteraceae bacterium]|nr:GAF domain-containing sensor histidine kinase [Candidatus Eremiobacteraceae bacterium]
MSSRAILIISLGLLAAAWIVDMLTPQALVAAIMLTVPVALASVSLNRRTAAFVVGAALAADAAAGWYNGYRAGYHWDSIAIGNRLLAAFSVVLVGWLGASAQTSAERSGRLSARQRAAERADAMRRAFERIRATLNVDLVARAIVREGVATLGADSALLYRLTGVSFADVVYAYDRDGSDVRVQHSPSPAGLAQFMRRALERRETQRLAPTDPVARLCLDALDADHALIVPLCDAQSELGALVLAAHAADRLDADMDLFVQAFGEQAGVAMAQANLFVELGEKNEELARANHAIADRSDVIRDLVYALSHDLRTPLAAAAMTLQQALDGKYGSLPEPYRDILRHSIESNSELRRLAETLLLVAKYEAGDQSTGRTAVPLGKVARSVVDELAPMWHAKRLQMRVGDDETAVALGDDAELRRATMNLLANAIAWTPEDGTIAVRITRDGRQVLISVEDDGYGVPKDERENLFERTSARSTRPGSGSGLGLYIVRRIAEGHGGSVRYEPVQPSGSRFTLILPAAAESSVA